MRLFSKNEPEWPKFRRAIIGGTGMWAVFIGVIVLLTRTFGVRFMLQSAMIIAGLIFLLWIGRLVLTGIGKALIMEDHND